MSIFVIVNEFEPKGGNPSVEIVENKYYSTEGLPPFGSNSLTMTKMLTP